MRVSNLLLWLLSPEELPEGCSAHRTKDDGILDCLRHFKEKGHHIFLCTLDKQFACRSQVRTLCKSVYIIADASAYGSLIFNEIW